MTEGKQDYKAARAQEIAEMSKEFGLYDYRELLIAHLLRECGSMSEYCDWQPGKASNDSGWAFGIAQWHLCYRERDWLLQNKLAKVVNGRCVGLKPITEIRDRYFASHPEMTDWRQQATRYLKEISDNVDRYGSVAAVVDSWNANPNYMAHVAAKKPLARSLLSL